MGEIRTMQKQFGLGAWEENIGKLKYACVSMAMQQMIKSFVFFFFSHFDLIKVYGGRDFTYNLDSVYHVNNNRQQIRKPRKNTSNDHFWLE